MAQSIKFFRSSTIRRFCANISFIRCLQAIDPFCRLLNIMYQFKVKSSLPKHCIAWRASSFGEVLSFLFVRWKSSPIHHRPIEKCVCWLSKESRYFMFFTNRSTFNVIFHFWIVNQFLNWPLSCNYCHSIIDSNGWRRGKIRYLSWFRIRYISCSIPAGDLLTEVFPVLFSLPQANADVVLSRLLSPTHISLSHK